MVIQKRHVESEVFEKLHGLGLHDRYAVAVSGGVDSMTLLHLVSVFHKQESKGLPPTVLTVNHGFRPEAEDETRFVQAKALESGLDCKILHLGGEGPRNSSQATAREIRYRLLHRWCTEHSVRYLLVAHNKNDQAETILMRLERGSGIDGLSGIHERSAFGTIVILRPLLGFTKRQILDYATKKKLPWVEDPSNTNPKYRRTFFRSLIANSNNPGLVTERLHRTASHLKRALSCIAHYVKASLDRCLEFSEFGFVVIKSQEFRSVPEEIATRLLLFSLMAMGGRNHKPRYSQFRSLFEKVWQDEHFQPRTLHGCKVFRHPDRNVHIVREVVLIDRRIRIGEAAKTVLQWDCRFTIKVVQADGVPLGASQTAVSGGLSKALTPAKPARDDGCVMPRDLYITPIADGPVPEHLKFVHRDVVSGLPVLASGDKVLAYPWQNNNIGVTPAVSVEEVLVRGGVISLICGQLYQ
ncbi:MAG: tRNA lysidine(34) synthetase TilS [Anaplasma sp.]